MRGEPSLRVGHPDAFPPPIRHVVQSVGVLWETLFHIAARLFGGVGGSEMSLTAADLEPRRALVGSVLRALRLLDLFERGRPEMSLAEFVRRSGYSKSTAYRLLGSGAPPTPTSTKS
jgi:hypothetical protein